MFHDEIINLDYNELLNKIRLAKENGQVTPTQARDFAFTATVIALLIRDKDIPSFYFNHDDFDDDNNLMNTGTEFFKEGIMDIPFDKCIYVLKNFVKEDDGSLDDGAILIFKYDDEFKERFLEACHHFRYQMDRSLVDNHKYIFVELDKVSGACTPCPYFVFINFDKDNFMNIMALPGFEDPRLPNKAGVASGSLSSATMLLNTKYASKNSTTISSKLNNRRLKNNKPLLHNYTTIRLSTSDRASSCGDGSHASPKPHWRRGHVRRYQNGKVSAISPCLVNWSGEEIKKKTYLVGECA